MLVPPTKKGDPAGSPLFGAVELLVNSQPAISELVQREWRVGKCQAAFDPIRRESGFGSTNLSGIGTMPKPTIPNLASPNVGDIASLAMTFE
jgi:hypothetical protein